MIEILQILFKEGLSPEDITHLEFMSNPAILSKSGINTKLILQENTETITEEQVVSKGFFGIGRVVRKIEKQQTIETKSGYWTSKNNLVLYLTAWVQILEEEPEQAGIKSQNLEQLHKSLLQAVSSEEYELAATIRDQITVTK